jgi:hypothetical protein
MQAITMGLPTLSRQLSTTCLVSTAEAGAAASAIIETAAIRRTDMNNPRDSKTTSRLANRGYFRTAMRRGQAPRRSFQCVEPRFHAADGRCRPQLRVVLRSLISAALFQAALF